jgi:predicted lipid-binding transport protein (Tim44 family)
MNLLGPDSDDDVAGGMIGGIVLGAKIGNFIGMALIVVMALCGKALAILIRALCELWQKRKANRPPSP